MAAALLHALLLCAPVQIFLPLVTASTGNDELMTVGCILFYLTIAAISLRLDWSLPNARHTCTRASRRLVSQLPPPSSPVCVVALTRRTHRLRP